jgi:hypothetical protein
MTGPMAKKQRADRRDGIQVVSGWMSLFCEKKLIVAVPPYPFVCRLLGRTTS